MYLNNIFLSKMCILYCPVLLNSVIFLTLACFHSALYNIRCSMLNINTGIGRFGEPVIAPW